MTNKSIEPSTKCTETDNGEHVWRSSVGDNLATRSCAFCGLAEASSVNWVITGVKKE